MDNKYTVLGDDYAARWTETGKLEICAYQNDGGEIKPNIFPRTVFLSEEETFKLLDLIKSDDCHDCWKLPMGGN